MKRNRRMKINERKEESSYKMISLDIPEEKRKEYIERAYCFSGRLILLPSSLESKLDFLIKENITSEEAVSEIEEMFIDGTYILSNLGGF